MPKFDFFHIINFVPIVCLILATIGNFIYLSWYGVLVSIFKILIIIALIVVEVNPIPNLIKHLSFLYSFIGRGTFYIFYGFLNFIPHVLGIIGAACTIVVGIVYIICYFLKVAIPHHMSYDCYKELVSGKTESLPVSTNPTY
ncbi:hypothetical protein BDB01DRAFT_787368 [Pilobolus umbonatus]|nr:hypothetical protein BDB01DRAFT_787368 [Pilobolus umbonatus]